MNLSVTTVDFLVVLVVLISTGYAVWRGFLWETLTVFAWVAAAFGCLYFGPAIVPLMKSMIGAPWLAGLIGYAAVFLAVLIPLSFISHRFSQTVKGSPIRPLDRALGAAFGVIRGLVIVGAAYIAFTYFVPVPQQPQWLAKAQTLPLIQHTDEVLLSLVPDRDHPGFALSPRGNTADVLDKMIRRDGLADRALSRRHRRTQSMHHKSAGPKRTDEAEKTYGAGDRRALDRLIETTGSGK